MKTYLLILYFSFLTAWSIAQSPPEQQQQPPQGHGPARQRVEALKVGFLTDRLNLTPDEAKVFWPVYNQYQDELELVRKSRRENLINAKMSFDQMSDKEVEKVIDSELMSRQSELDLQKKYNSRFKQVLPVKKVAKLYKAEEDFKRQLLEKIKENRMDGKAEKRALKNK